MAVGQFTLYSANKADLNLNDLLTVTVKLALVGSGYTPDTATDGDGLWADVSANEIANGDGYATGGSALTNEVVTAISGGWKYATDDVVLTASGSGIPAWRYAVLYVSGTLWGMTNPLIGYFLGDATPADIPLTPNGNTLTLGCPTDGWLSVT